MTYLGHAKYYYEHLRNRQMILASHIEQLRGHVSEETMASLEDDLRETRCELGWALEALALAEMR